MVRWISGRNFLTLDEYTNLHKELWIWIFHVFAVLTV